MRRFGPAGLVLALALALAACGSSNSSSSTSSGGGTSTSPASGGGATTSKPPPSGATSQVSFSADPGGQLKFDKTSASAKAGTVTLTLRNPAPVPHGIAVQGKGVNKVGQVVSQGGVSTVTVKLTAGSYTFYCPVPGHRQAGMQGTLTVN